MNSFLIFALVYCWPRVFRSPSTNTCSRAFRDQSSGRQAVRTTIVSLEQQTDLIVDAAQGIGITINVS